MPAAIIYTVSKIVDLFLSFFFSPSSSETSNNNRVAIYSSCLLFLYLAYVVINSLIKIRYFENLCTRMKKKKKYMEN